jgi:hypothetical protein
MAETGHAVNIAHFDKLITYCESYAGDYNPSNPLLETAPLHTLYTEANTFNNDVASTLADTRVAINDRETKFSGIRKLTTRCVNAFAVSGATENAVEDAKGLQRKINGARAKALPDDDPGTPDDESKGISVSQQSYVQLAEHFKKMIDLFQSDGHYDPNETELQLGTLDGFLAACISANSNVSDNLVSLDFRRNARNATLYADGGEGLVDRAQLVKKYVKSLYGADSPQYKQVAALEFRRIPV